LEKCGRKKECEKKKVKSKKRQSEKCKNLHYFSSLIGEGDLVKVFLTDGK